MQTGATLKLPGWPKVRIYVQIALYTYAVQAMAHHPCQGRADSVVDICGTAADQQLSHR